MREALFACVLLAVAPAGAAAQAVVAQVGVQVIGVRLSALGEGPAGVGVRAMVDRGRVGLDVEIDHFPENPSGNFGETLWLAGGRVRLAGSRLALFARARGGRIYFGGSYYEHRLRERAHPAFDVGLTLERRFSSRLTGRFDAGDLIVPFGDETFVGGTPAPRRLGVTHSYMVALGLTLRFEPR